MTLDISPFAQGLVQSRIGRRPLTLLALLGIHALLVTALVSGLAQHTVYLPPPDIGVVVSAPPMHAPPSADPLPEPRMRPVGMTPPIPPAVPPVRPDEDVPGTTATAVSDLPMTTLARQPAGAGPIVLEGAHHLPSTEQFYPPGAIRRGVEGAPQIRVCVDEQGRLRESPQIIRSSGDAQLDAGALAVGRAGHFARAVRDGRPVPNCYDFRIVFRLR